MKTAPNPVYQPCALVRTGGRHREQAVNGQDHAVVGHHASAVVLCVADGVSLIVGGGQQQHSRNEVGSWLAAEVALTAALRALDKGTKPESVVDSVAGALHRSFNRLWTEIGLQHGQLGLTTTLLLAIVTPTWTGIYASGDGYWGVTLPVWDGAPPDLASIQGEALVETVRPDGAAVFGCQTRQPVRNLASVQARLDAAAVRSALRPVLLCPQPVLAVHIATDGLEDERPLLDKLRRGPCRAKNEVEGTLERPESSDDLALAWTFTRVPGMFGEVEARPQALDSRSEAVAHV